MSVNEAVTASADTLQTVSDISLDEAVASQVGTVGTSAVFGVSSDESAAASAYADAQNLSGALINTMSVDEAVTS